MRRLVYDFRKGFEGLYLALEEGGRRSMPKRWFKPWKCMRVFWQKNRQTGEHPDLSLDILGRAKLLKIRIAPPREGG